MEVLYQLSYPGEALTIAPGSSARTRTPVRSAGGGECACHPDRLTAGAERVAVTAAAGNSPTSTFTTLVYCEPSS